jgi:hypothetical protein
MSSLVRQYAIFATPHHHFQDDANIAFDFLLRSQFDFFTLSAFKGFMFLPI